MTAFVETIARFGPDASLVGILTVPAAPQDDRPTIVIVNTGVVHRIGNHRMHVAFARTLAAAGYPVLRFDPAGLGDSAPRRLVAGALGPNDADLRDALDWLTTRGHADFILMGLCAGADRGVVHAGTDLRVRGLILLDPTLTPTIRFIRNRIATQLVEITRRNPLPNLARRLRRRTIAYRASPDVTEQRRTGPLAFLKRRHIHAYLQAAYARVMANDVDLLAVFTSSVQQRHNYREQMLDAFRSVAFGERLSLHYLEGTTHLLLHERERGQCLAIVLAWLQRLPQPRRRAAPV